MLILCTLSPESTNFELCTPAPPPLPETYRPAHEMMILIAYTISEGSDEPAHPRSLVTSAQSRHIRAVSSHPRSLVTSAQSSQNLFCWHMQSTFRLVDECADEKNTVNSNIFAMVSFSRNFADAKFREN